MTAFKETQSRQGPRLPISGASAGFLSPSPAVVLNWIIPCCRNCHKHFKMVLASTNQRHPTSWCVQILSHGPWGHCPQLRIPDVAQCWTHRSSPQRKCLLIEQVNHFYSFLKISECSWKLSQPLLSENHVCVCVCVCVCLPTVFLLFFKICFLNLDHF